MIDEYLQCCTSAKRKSRTDHNCCECHGKIGAGEAHHVTTGLADGSWCTYRVCDECEALRTEVDKNVTYDDERTAFGGLCESVVESREVALLVRYVANRKKRGAKVPDWMEERAKEVQS